MSTDQTVRDVMTPNPVSMHTQTSVLDAARAMRDRDIGDVVVLKPDGEVCGMVTDRDIVVRVVAEGRDPATTSLEEICSHEVFAVTPGDEVKRAVDLMMQRSVRRLPVMESGRLVGIVSLGDLARERDPKSALGLISQAHPNN